MNSHLLHDNTLIIQLKQHTYIGNFTQKYLTRKSILYSFLLVFTRFYPKLLETCFFWKFNTRLARYSFYESHSSTSEYECQKRGTHDRVLERVSSFWPHYYILTVKLMVNILSTFVAFSENLVLMIGKVCVGKFGGVFQAILFNSFENDSLWMMTHKQIQIQVKKSM